MLCFHRFIMQMHLQVEATLNAELTRERTGVGALKAELTALQADVIAAQARLADTQTRVEQELERVNALRQEAVSLLWTRHWACTYQRSLHRMCQQCDFASTSAYGQSQLATFLFTLSMLRRSHLSVCAQAYQLLSQLPFSHLLHLHPPSPPHLPSQPRHSRPAH